MIYIGIAATIVLIAFRLAVRSRKIGYGRAVHKRSDAIPPELFEFLEKADDAYILTHQMIDISHFSPYAANSLCHEIMESIYKNPPKMFGIKRHRVRTWDILERGKGEVLLRKEIAHARIEVKRGIKVALGDDMIEFWKVSLSPAGFKVEDVT